MPLSYRPLKKAATNSLSKLERTMRTSPLAGALSPTKIMEWKLGETLSILTEHIFRIDEAFFEVLGKTL